MSHRVSAQAFFLRTPNSHRTTGHTCTNVRRVQQFIKAVSLLCTSSRRSSWLAATYWTPSRFRCSDTCSGTAAPVSTCFAPGFPLRATDTRCRRCSCHPWALGQAPMLFRTKHLHAFKPSVGNKHLQTSILAHSSTYACRGRDTCVCVRAVFNLLQPNSSLESKTSSLYKFFSDQKPTPRRALKRSSSGSSWLSTARGWRVFWKEAATCLVRAWQGPRKTFAQDLGPKRLKDCLQAGPCRINPAKISKILSSLATMTTCLPKQKPKTKQKT